MKTNQWIQDVQRIIGCAAPELLCILAEIATEDNSRGLFVRKCQSKILECIEDVKMFLGEIRRNAQDFTLHDIQHCINVIDFMGQMLVDVKKSNPAEISFFIYSALLHDIGMVKMPEEDITLNDLREDHGDRSARFIRERKLLNYDGTSFSFGEFDYVYMEYLPLICASHMQEFSFVQKLPQSYILEGMEVDMSLCAILLRVADAMDLKRNRAPYQLYQFLINRSISPDHWKKHMSISNCQVNKNGVYRVDGICHDEAAHRCLFNHLDSIELEIEKIFKWKNGPHPRLKLRSHIIERNIKSDGYKIWNHSFSMDILKITNLFMGEQLYGDKRFGLREIIQNSIDACMVRDEINKSLGINQDYSYKPEIFIVFDRENNQVIIRDNGTGMNDYIIENFFLNIGTSYYSSRDFKKLNLKYSPSGHFGIGFLACFMLSDEVYLRTAHWQGNVEYEIHFIRGDKFVTKIEKPKTFSGTEVRFNLDQFKKVFMQSPYSTFRNTDTYKRYYVEDFLYETFWNLKITLINKDVIWCSFRTDSFMEVAKERNRAIYDYIIDLSEYLNDIEGIIVIFRNMLFDIVQDVMNIYRKDPLDALKNGEIKIGNKINDIFPFIKHFYKFNNNSIVECKYIKEISNVDTFLFFTTEDSKVNEEIIMRKKSDLSDIEIKKIFSLNHWNCLCYEDDHYVDGIYGYTYEFKLITDQGDDYERIYINKLCKHLGYYPSCFIILYGLNGNSLNRIDYLYDVEIDKFLNFNGRYWLNYARINLSDGMEDIVFSFIRVYEIVMRITNSLILPDTSRKLIIDSSASILKKAIRICIYLWLYENTKNYKVAVKTSKYLKQLILEEWDDSVEGLLKSEKKPT